MSSRKKPGARVKKKPYIKPEIKQVQLRPEEAVLGACKETTGTSGAGGWCQLTCPFLGS